MVVSYAIPQLRYLITLIMVSPFVSLMVPLITDVYLRFEPQFLEERSQALQAFLLRVLAEIPVTSSDAMMEFLEVT